MWQGNEGLETTEQKLEVKEQDKYMRKDAPGLPILPHTWPAGTLPSALSLPELDLFVALLSLPT